MWIGFHLSVESNKANTLHLIYFELNLPVTVLAAAPPAPWDGVTPADRSVPWLAGWSDKIVLPRATACWGALGLATPSGKDSLSKNIISSPQDDKNQIST